MNMQYFPRQQRLAVALAMAFCGATGFAAAGAVQAQGAVAASQQYDIPAGTLTQVLNQFAQRAGVSLSFDPALTAGKQSNGLKGGYSMQQGFAVLLQGSGLEIAPSGNGYTLRRLPATGSAMLPEVKVMATSDGTTEGTGSYTTRATSTATKLTLSPRETPQSISVVTRQQMEDQGMLQLTDAFKQVTGLTFVEAGSPGTDANTIYSRGFAVENYQVDGVPQLNSWVLETSDLAIYDRVEVLRGATGLMNGVGSPAATINLVRKRPAKDFQGSASVTAGSWNFKRIDADISGALNEAGNVRGRLVAALQDNDSFIDWMSQKKAVFYGAVDVDITAATRLTFGLEYQKHNTDQQARSGMPLYYADGSRATFDRSQNSGAKWAYSHQLHRSAFVALDHQFDNEWVLKANLSQARRKYDDVVGYIYGTGPAGSFYAAPNRDGTGVNLLAGKWNAEYVQNALDAYVSGPVQLFGRKHELVFGYNVSRTTYDAPWYNMWQRLPIANLNTWNGSDPAEPDWNVIGMTNFEERQSGLYGSGRFRMSDQFSLLAGVRVSNWKQTTVENDRTAGTRTTGVREENGVVTPYLGATYDLTRDWSLYASYANIFKPQNNRTVTGDYVEPVTGVNSEIGVKSTFLDGRLNFSAAYFRVQQDNLAVIDGARLAPDGSQAYRAADGVRTTGYELEVAGEPILGWNIIAGYTQRSSQDADGNNVATEAPNNMFKVFTTYRIAAVGNGLTVGGGARWQGDIYAEGVGPNWDQRFTQEAYTVVDLMARYPLSKDVTLSANLNNVFDKEYYTTVYSGYYGAPRNLRVNLSYKF